MPAAAPRKRKRKRERMSLDARQRPADKATQRRDKPLHANSRTALQRTVDLAFISKWRVLGMSIDAIAEKLNAELAGTRVISRAQVGHDTKKIDNAWRAERAQSMEKLKERELARLDTMEAELWASWERSKLDAERLMKQVTEDGKVGADGKFVGDRKTVQSVLKHKQNGDVAIMAALTRISDQRSKIYGFAAPVKMEHTGTDGAPLPASAIAPIIHVTIAAPPKE